MIAALIPLAAKLVGPRFAKPFVIGALILAACLALWGVVAWIRADAVDEHVTRERAEKAESTLKAERKANEGDAEKATAEADRANALEGVSSNAIRNDPEKGQRPVGPATGGVLGELRDRQP